MSVLDFVGFVPRNINDETTTQRRPVWVIWLDDPTKSLAEQIPPQFSCPFCSHVIRFPSFMGTSLRNPDVFEFITRCDTCFSHLIFNKAPKDLRDQISWPQYPKTREF